MFKAVSQPTLRPCHTGETPACRLGAAMLEQSATCLFTETRMVISGNLDDVDSRTLALVHKRGADCKRCLPLTACHPIQLGSSDLLSVAAPCVHPRLERIGGNNISGKEGGLAGGSLVWNGCGSGSFWKGTRGASHLGWGRCRSCSTWRCACTHGILVAQ